MKRSPIVLIIMVLGLMGAYFYYLYIKKKNAPSEEERAAEEIALKKSEQQKEKAKSIPEKMPVTLKIFITLLAVYTAFLLVDSLFGAYGSLEAGGTIFLSLAFVFLPASLRLLTIAFALKKIKLFRITYIAAVLVSVIRFVYYSISGSGTVDVGIWIILAFYAAWIVYLFRSQYIRYRFTDGSFSDLWKKSEPKAK